MTRDPDRKAVQTYLDSAEYARLRRVADEEGLTLKEALRRAVAEYTGSHDRNDPEDPFFADPVEGESTTEALSATETESYR